MKKHLTTAILRGGRGKSAGYQQTSIRCPQPASAITRELLNLYRLQYQHESPEAAQFFLSEVLDFAQSLASGTDESPEGDHVSLDDVVANIENGKPGYKRNSASKLISDVLAIVGKS
jgi:hypothetical protein